MLSASSVDEYIINFVFFQSKTAKLFKFFLFCCIVKRFAHFLLFKIENPGFFPNPGFCESCKLAVSPFHYRHLLRLPLALLQFLPDLLRNGGEEFNEYRIIARQIIRGEKLVEHSGVLQLFPVVFPFVAERPDDLQGAVIIFISISSTL